MRITIMLMLAALSLSVAAGRHNAGVIPLMRENGLSIQIQNTPLPVDVLARELDSGLPNSILYILSFFAGKELVGVKTIKYTVTYDLWDEDYRLEISSDDQTGQAGYKQKDVLLRKLSSLEIKGLDLPDLDDEYRIEIQTVFNPIKADRIEEIQAWFGGRAGEAVVLPSAPQAGGSGVGGTRQRSRGPRFKKLFDKILEQYGEDGDTVGQWRSEVITVNFRVPKTPGEK